MGNKSKQRSIHLAGGAYEGWKWDFVGSCVSFRLTTPYKARIRRKDRHWIANNLPSSIWWGLETHHNWEDGGRMYLLTHELHQKLSH